MVNQKALLLMVVSSQWGCQSNAVQTTGCCTTINIVKYWKSASWHLVHTQNTFQWQMQIKQHQQAIKTW